MTTKQRLEQLGWVISEDEFDYGFLKSGKDFISYNKKYNNIDLSMVEYDINLNELQLILDYINEQN